MELIVRIRNRTLLEKVASYVDGIEIGSAFTMGYPFRTEEFYAEINKAKALGLKVYVCVDNFIFEDERTALRHYLQQLGDLDIDGLCFHDLGIMELTRGTILHERLYYDGKSVLCNSHDAAFLLAEGIRSVQIANELTLAEVRNIIRNNYGCIDMQVFGHQRMSYSHRRFLRNYFRQIGKDYDYLNKPTLSLIEEQRNYPMPVYEDKNGTYIYTDYILLMFEELAMLKEGLNRAIIETAFINNDELIRQIARDYRRLSSENQQFLKENFLRAYPGPYSPGYLYQKTNIVKDGQ